MTVPARIAAAILTLFAVTTPASAATIDYLGADVSLNFPSNIFSPLTGLPTTLTGDIQLQLYDSPPAPFPTDYKFTGDFSLGPYPLSTNPNYGFVPGIPPQDGVPNGLYLFGTVGVPILRTYRTSLLQRSVGKAFRRSAEP